MSRATAPKAIEIASIDAWQSQFAERGWSNWAVELLSSSVFIGFVGLSVPRRVMERIGTRNAHEDFDCPSFPENHPSI